MDEALAHSFDNGDRVGVGLVREVIPTVTSTRRADCWHVAMCCIVGNGACA